MIILFNPNLRLLVFGVIDFSATPLPFKLIIIPQYYFLSLMPEVLGHLSSPRLLAVMSK